jgi:hypothetical protein
MACSEQFFRISALNFCRYTGVFQENYRVIDRKRTVSSYVDYFQIGPVVLFWNIHGNKRISIFS